MKRRPSRSAIAVAAMKGLGALLLALVVVFYSGRVKADTVAPSYTWQGGGYTSAVGATSGAAAQGYCTTIQSAGTAGYQTTVGDSTTFDCWNGSIWKCTGTQTSSTGQACYSLTRVYSCPADHTLTGGQCVDNPTCPAAGAKEPHGGTMYSGTGASPSTLCIGGCSWDTGNGVRFPATNEWFAWAAVSLGTTCTANGTGNEAPAQCAVGTCPGTVTLNGVTTTSCYPCSSNPAATTTEKKATSSSETTAGGTTTTNTTTTTTTTNNSTSVTTSTTVNYPDGSTKTTSTTEEKPINTFCKENPQASICLKSSFSGSCSSAFACEGDAVQCATARASYELNCELTKEDATTQLARDILAGNDPMAAQLPSASNATVLNVGSESGGISQASWIASNSCPGDRVIQFGDYQIRIPFSAPNVCEALQMMGNLLVMFALLTAFFIVGIF